MIESGSWQTKHDNFNVNVKVVQIPGSNGVEIGPKYPFFINETTALYNGNRTGYKEYPLEDYSLDFLRPDESFQLSVTAEKSVNVMVLDANNENKFGTVQPI